MDAIAADSKNLLRWSRKGHILAMDIVKGLVHLHANKVGSTHMYTLATLMLIWYDTITYHGIQSHGISYHYTKPYRTVPYHTIPYHTYARRMDLRHLVASLLSQMSPGSSQVRGVLCLCIIACPCMHARD